MRRMSNFDEESEYQDFTEMQNRYDADRSRESRNFRYRNDEAYDRCAVPRNHRAYDRPFYNFSSEVPHTSHDTLTSIFIKKETAELSSSDSRSEEFAAPVGSDNMPITNFCTNGLPLVGTHLSPGDCVIYKKVTTYSFDKEQVVRVKYVPTRLNTYTEGQVISAEIYEKMGKTIAEVLVATRASAEVGDKLAGRYGNKGVIAKIVPEEEMPYDPVSGKSLDILLNPLGIPSRMNISQLYEVGLGAAEHKENKISIVSPFHPDSCKFVEEKMQEAGIHPIRLIDGKTGQFFERPINVGYQYLEKLVHMVRKKIHAVGFDHGVNSVTLQAKSSAKMNGGQAFGEMESWCLESIGANKVLQEIQTVLADDRDKRADIMQQIEENPYDMLTGEEQLLENTTGWHDNTWGDCSCPKCKNITGQNLLGKALMEVRASFAPVGKFDLLVCYDELHPREEIIKDVSNYGVVDNTYYYIKDGKRHVITDRLLVFGRTDFFKK